MVRICMGLLILLGGGVLGPGKAEGDEGRGGDAEVQVGGLYSSKNEDGTWGVLKVLVVDESTVHIRTYANKFQEQPKDLDPASLTMGKMGDPGGFGVGHMPLARVAFLSDDPVLIKVVPVEESELEGYQIYLEAMQEQE